MHDPKRATGLKLPSYAAFLQWTDPQRKKDAPRFISLLHVQQIARNHRTQAFFKQQQKRGKNAVPPSDLSFSLITDKRTVDLATTDPGERDRWIMGLQDVITELKQKEQNDKALSSRTTLFGNGGGPMKSSSAPGLATFLRLDSIASTTSELSVASESEEGEYESGKEDHRFKELRQQYVDELGGFGDHAHCFVAGAGSAEANGVYVLISKEYWDFKFIRFKKSHTFA